MQEESKDLQTGEQSQNVADADLTHSSEKGSATGPSVNTESPPLSTVRKGILLTKTHAVILTAVVLALVGASVGVGMWINERKNDPWRIESDLTDYGDFSSSGGTSDQIVIPGYGDILLEADTRDVMLILPNPASNPCYFRFSILLKESNEVIYTSGLVPPGKAIEALTLKRDFPKGDYPAVIQIETFSLDRSRTPLNGANVEVILNFR